MTSLTVDLDPKLSNLDPKVLNVGRLIGLLTQDDRINKDWFAHADTEIGNIPRRVRELLQLTANVLGPGTTPAGVPGGTWYSIPNPMDEGKKPTGFYLVAPPPPSTSPASATIGLGVLKEIGYGNLSITAYGYVPLFKLSSDASPSLVISTQPSSIGVVASLKDEKFTADTVKFSSMKLDVSFTFSLTPALSMNLTFDGLEGDTKGAPAKYTSLQQLLDHIDPAGAWMAAVILQGTYWLHHYVGGSDYTIGDILTTACVLTVDGDGKYHLNLDYLKANVTNPKVLAENFFFNLLHKLSESEKPIVPISVGAKGSGIYVVREKADGGAFDYGARLMINDLKVGKKTNDKDSPPPEISLQIGKWIAGEEDKNSWVARSLGQTSNFAQPGVSVYLLQSKSTAGECKSTGPDVTFNPRVELVSLGLDVHGGAGQPLFDIGGYKMRGAELRAYVKQSGSNVVFGGAASIDELGVPLGPKFGSGAQGKDSNPVAQSLLESGKPAEDKKDEKEGDKAPVNPTFSMSAAYVKGGNFAFQLYDKDGKPSDKVVLPIQRALGPLQCEKIGLGWVQKDKFLSLLFDGGIHLDVLSVDLYGLSVGMPIGSPGDFSKYKLDLDGMGLALKAGQVELSGAFIKLAPDTKLTPPRNYPEYNGAVNIKAGNFSITAIGSYAYVTEAEGGYASMFIFGALEGNLGGPAFFYVTGIAAGFGYNRGLVLPEMDGVADFPLVAAAADPKKLGGLPPDPKKALQGLGSTVPAVRGNYWLAAGVRFTSFDLVNTTALLVVQFGQELEIALLGVSKITLPPPSAGGESKVKYAYAELGMQVKLLPAKGFFSATAVLTSNSYVLDPACKLTGGFAFYVWFGPHENAGQFVLTLGGYHPDFSPPAHYPKVPRLGFNWPLPGNVTISGEAYFALTPSAVMAGAGLQVLYSAGNLQAWFKAQMDALVSWAPFHYRLDISISIGASYRVNLLFVTTTLKVELGASLAIWGPPMGGRVHINWYIISFTVSFGADESKQPEALKWTDKDGTGFAQTLLPHKTKPALKSHDGLLAAPADTVEPDGVFTITAPDGLVSTFKKDGKEIWIVRANHLVLSAMTTFPATEVDIVQSSTATAKFKPKDVCGADYTNVYIRPMNAEITSSVFNVKMTDSNDKVYDLPAAFDLKFSCQSVLAAKWGKPVPAGQKPEMNETLPKRLMGLEKITPKAPALSPIGPLALNIDIARAFTYDTVDQTDPDHLPLAPGQTPVGPVPAVKADAFEDIKRSLTSTTVTTAREKLLSTLQGYGFDPVTNAPMTTLATNPGAVLVGKPLIIAAS